MKRWLMSAGMGVAVCVMAATAQFQDFSEACMQHTAATEDRYSLNSYKISPEAECCFDNTDGKLSDFWHAWDSLASLERIFLGPQDLSYGPQPIDTSDVKLTVKATWGDSGIYLLFKVRDDGFPGVTGTALADHPYAADAVEFCIDPNSSQELYSNADELMRDLSQDQATYNFWQLQINFGYGGGGLDSISWNWLNENFRDPMFDEVGLNQAMIFQQWGKGNAYQKALAENEGVYYEAISLGNTLEAQEWFIKWRAVGHPFGQVTGGQVGQKFAVSMGYDDIDAGQDDVSALRWRCRADPWSGLPRTDSTADCWGDFHLVGNLEDTLADAGIDVTYGCTCDDGQSISNHLSVPRLFTRQGSVRYFTVDGRELSSVRSAVARGTLTANSIILRCRVNKEGGIISTRKVIAADLVR